MSFIQENKIELNLSLKNEYKLIHISDVHAVTYKDTDSKEEIDEALKAEELWYRQRTWFAGRAKEHYDESHMIPSKDCLANLVNYINNEKPTAAILSGDIIDYYTKSNYELLVNSIKNINCPYVFCNGNHEPNIDKYEAITNSIIGYSTLNFDEFKIVSLDNSTKHISNETLNLVKKELEVDKPIIIVMHIPISTKYNENEMKKFDPYFVIYENDTDETTKEFIDILVNNDNIKTILCGHTHGHLESYFAPNKLQCCASSGLIGLVNKITIK